MSDDPIERFERRLYYQQLFQQLPLKTIFKDLSEEERDLLRLHIVEDRSAKEIAELLNQDVKEIRWKWNKLSMKLRTRAKSVIKERPKLY